MKRDVRTLFMAARQVVVLAADGSPLAGLVPSALPMPRYVVRRTADPGKAAELVSRSKIEVLLLDGGGLDEAVIQTLRAADPDVEIVLALDRNALGGALPPAFETCDLIGLPASPAELVRRVEGARERRFLRRSEERGKRTEARMSAIMQAVSTGVVSIDAEGIVHDWNPAAARIFGWEEVEALGRDFWTLVLADGRPASFFDGDQHLVPGQRRELVARHRSGRLFPIELALSSFPAGDRAMLCAIVEDRTEAKRLALELQQAQKLESVGQLAAGLAHEINTPCQFIGDHAAAVGLALEDVARLLGRFEALRESVARGGPSAALAEEVGAEVEAVDLPDLLDSSGRSLAAVREGVQRISTIVRAMKDFSRVDWQEGGPVDVNQAVGSVLTVLEHELAPIADVVQELGAVPMVEGHGGEINQALFNLVRNAGEAMARAASVKGRGTLRVATRAQDDGVCITIQDSGAGIPAAVQPRIFDPFFTTKEVGQGAGQGLAVAWGVCVTKHGGRIAVDSAEGEGATFTVYLPRRRAAA